MAHNSRIRADWALNDVPSEAEWDLFDLRQFQSINGDLGGTWAPSGQIIVGGSGLWVMGPSKLDDADVTITTGNQLLVESGGSLETAAGTTNIIAGTTTMLGTIGVSSLAVFEFNAGSILRLKNLSITQFKTGSTILFEGSGGSGIEIDGFAQFIAGSQLQIYGDFDFQAGCSVALHDEFVVRSDGKITFEAGGELEFEGSAGSGIEVTGFVQFKSGGQVQIYGDFDFQAGCEVALHDQFFIRSDGEIVVESGGEITVESGGEIAIENGGVLNLSGEMDCSSATISGDATRTGPTTYSGNTAYSTRRQVTLTDSTQSINPEKNDIVFLPTPAANRTLTLDVPPGNDRVECTLVALGGGNNWIIRNHDAVFMNNASTDTGDLAWADVYFNGSDWVIIRFFTNP